MHVACWATANPSHGFPQSVTSASADPVVVRWTTRPRRAFTGMNSPATPPFWREPWRGAGANPYQPAIPRLFAARIGIPMRVLASPITTKEVGDITNIFGVIGKADN